VRGVLPMRIEHIRQRLRAHDAKPVHEHRVLRLWSQALPYDQGRNRPEDFLPLAAARRAAGAGRGTGGAGALRAEHPGEDGSARLLVDLADGQTVESVLLPRDGLCVSTQVGCAVGCVFCMTGRDGLLRQLGSAEIVAQVALARARRPVRKVVFMGMGEPAHNLDNVLEAIELLGTAGGIGHKNLVFSTVGDPRVFERLPQGRVKPALACPCTPPGPICARELLPRRRASTRPELVELGERYARATGYPIQYQWTLLDGHQRHDEELEGIVRLLSGKYAMMNIIPYNATAWPVTMRMKKGCVTVIVASACGRARLAPVVQHAVGQFEHVAVAGIAQHQVDDGVPLGCLRASEAGHGVEEALYGRVAQQVQHRAHIARLLRHAVSQLPRAAQVGVAPRPRFRLVTELVVGARQQLARRAIVRLGEHQVGQHLGRPSGKSPLSKEACALASTAAPPPMNST
jgi:23S rRNA (adenine2503-C2)-methyltransferase